MTALEGHVRQILSPCVCDVKIHNRSRSGDLIETTVAVRASYVTKPDLDSVVKIKLTARGWVVVEDDS